MATELKCGSFWAAGELSALEQACLASFVSADIPLTLFSYEPIPNLPVGVMLADAADVVPRAMTERLIYDGKPNLSHFSDLFRYEMIRQRDLVWVDADVLAIGLPPRLPHENIVVREIQGGVNGAVLYAGAEDLRASLMRRVEACFDRPLRWGETGPAIVAAAAAELSVPTYGPEVFYPIEHYDIWKVLLPEHRDQCAEDCHEAFSLHLFNNILVTMGYWKQIAPPSGSFLHEQLADRDLLGFFESTYPADVMRRCIENFRFRQNGKALGVKSVLRELVPSVGRTVRHYRK